MFPHRAALPVGQPAPCSRRFATVLFCAFFSFGSISVTDATDEKSLCRDATPDASALANRGNSYNSKGDYDCAIADYSEAIRLNPKFAEAFNNRGYSYANKGDYHRAIADYSEAIRLNPKDPDVFNNRGYSYVNKGDYDHAITDYSEAIRLNPQYAKAFKHRSAAYMKKGDRDHSIADLTESLKLDSTDQEARDLLNQANGLPKP